MSELPFALRRPWLLARDLLVDREHPDLSALARLTDPERFLWAILPHAARTFSACIALLPARAARASAVAYLYCRILDTYEDLAPDLDGRLGALRAFAARFPATPAAAAPGDEASAPAALPPAPALPDTLARDARDRAHLLLANRCELIDRVYLRLPAPVRGIIGDLVRDMAQGMAESARLFHEQGGTLADDGQLLRYCRAVLGNPVLFVARLARLSHTGRDDLLPDEREAAMVSGEFIQLANVTRDIEKDLRRGLAYDPRLAGDLHPADSEDGAAAARSAHGPRTGRGDTARANRPPGRDERVRAVREHQLVLALERAPAYERLVDCLDHSRFSLIRASAVLMLLFTERYYRSCALRAGRPAFVPRRSGPGLIGRSLAAALSRSWSRRLVARTVARLAGAAGGPPSAAAPATDAHVPGPAPATATPPTAAAIPPPSAGRPTTPRGTSSPDRGR